jgi:NADH-quinone oxidoreductase subunit L
MSLEFDPALDFKLLLAVLLIPLAGYALQIFLRRRLPHGDKLLTLGMFVAMCITVWLGLKGIHAAHLGERFFHHSSEAGMEVGWLYTSGTVPAEANILLGILYDPLGAAMLAVVGIVSFCVHLFSIGYMHGDRRYPIFFANISLFTFAMLGLVLADNLLVLFVFWELMGAMSYLLIGHFSHDPSQPFFHRWATWASKKAFLTTRIGDVLLFVGIFILWDQYHTLRFTELWAAAKETVAANGGEFPAWLTWAGLCVFGGTVGKSAQFPLHIWLPDAMAGPTPVSAMIHAATMVAAGVFLLGRMYPVLSPTVLGVVTVVGATTALFAATIGTTCYDLKAVLAYSTISQLGFMVTAVGLGGVVAGMFHMTTHAFFKACLFLSAGSVIHGCHHVQDMRLMGGLRKSMPITFACMLACTLAIAGVPLFSGFYSKDKIIQAGWLRVLDREHFDGWSLYALLALCCAAALTAFYMFRLVFLTFYGEYRGNRAEHRFSAMLAAEGVEGPDPNEHAEHESHGAHATHGAHDSHGGHGEHDEHGPVRVDLSAPEVRGHGREPARHAPAAAHAVHAEAHGHGHGGHAHHEPHESPRVITVALMILAFLGIFGGHFWLVAPQTAWSGHPWFESLVSETSLYGREIADWLAPQPAGEESRLHHEHLHHQAHTLAVVVSVCVASLGISLAWLLYVRRIDVPGRVVAALGQVYTAVRRKYYVDELVDATVIRLTWTLTHAQKAFDENVVDGGVRAVGGLNKLGGTFAAWFDRVFIDGAVNAVALASQVFGAAFRLVQTGRIQQYAAFAVGGAVLTAAWLILA